jgi:hypothetical protein
MRESTTAEILDRSRKLYGEYNLSEWAAALPATIAGSGQTEEDLRKARAGGLDGALAFPPTAVQRATFWRLVDAMAHGAIMVEGKELPYAEPFLGAIEEIAVADPRNRPEGAYILCYSSGSYPEETRNLNAPQSAKLFAAKGWTSMTASEYLVLQRVQAGHYGDHRWHDYFGDDYPAQRQWLLDTHVPQGCAAAYWNGRTNQLSIYACKVGSKNPKRGTHPTRIIPLNP